MNNQEDPVLLQSSKRSLKTKSHLFLNCTYFIKISKDFRAKRHVNHELDVFNHKKI